ncbi:hypothetical protein H5410_029317 [Solanum commersonii]|uniref:Uncharacterized protein n=1 Tax=Solanum commersonii TaxID=4109 RepID=A0A9J5Z4M8_SOLCO|nr:hypothetical protein H5410_029317 [Solanum commersonii]
MRWNQRKIACPNADSISRYLIWYRMAKRLLSVPMAILPPPEEMWTLTKTVEIFVYSFVTLLTYRPMREVFNSRFIDSIYLVWSASKDGTFSVEKCCSLLMKQTGYWDTSWPWKGIWRTNAPIKNSYTLFGIFLLYLGDFFDHASECEGIVGELAAPENA